MNQSSGVDRNRALNRAKQDPESFAAIQDMPEFQKIMADTPLTEADKRSMEADRKRDMYWKNFVASHKSYVAVKADGEIFTGIVLSRVGHILVPASVTKAAAIQAKIADYQPAKVVAVDSESRLGSGAGRWANRLASHRSWKRGGPAGIRANCATQSETYLYRLPDHSGDLHTRLSQCS